MGLTLEPNPVYLELCQRTREAKVLSSCGDVLAWDERTYMPRKGSNHRADQMALLARLSHEMSTSPRIGDLLGQLESTSEAVDAGSLEAANIREIRRSYNRLVKLPVRLVEELARITTQAQQVWAMARQENDFSAFQPYLQQIVKLKREEAQAVGYQDVPYDALLDEYEPGARAQEITRVFQALRSELTPLIAAIQAARPKPDPLILQREYPVDLQKIFGQAAAAAVGFDFDAGRLDTTTHPFCSGMGPGDCRITTRYNPHQFNEAFFGILHEAGHGIYEQGLPASDFGLPSGSYCSLGIHESQSRLWENQVGRSRPFWEHFFPRAQQTFLTALRDVTFDDFLFAINEVKPSLIRVEADEATYNLHIILRFEIEQALLNGDLAVADLPLAWNSRMKELIGLDVREDRLGCLQDIHWSGGGIGYFPTYTLGNLFAAQFMETARKALPDLDESFREGNYLILKNWLNEKVHQPGRRFSSGDLCLRVTGKALDHQPLLRYLKYKYHHLYQIN